MVGAWREDKPVVLLLHGNGGCRTGCLPLAEQLAVEKYSVFMPSLRTRGRLDRQVERFWIRARYDVEAAVAWLKQNRPASKIVIWGQSLGVCRGDFGRKRFK